MMRLQLQEIGDNEVRLGVLGGWVLVGKLVGWGG